MNTPVGVPSSLRTSCPASSSASQAVSSKSRCCGIKAFGLARRNAEELGIELIDAVEETAPPGCHPSRRCGARIEVVPDIDAVGGNFGDGIPALAEKAPEACGIAHAARKPTTDSHDSDGRCRAVWLAIHSFCWLPALAALIIGAKISETFARTAARCGSR